MLKKKRQVCSHILIIYLLSIAMRTMTFVHQSKKFWTGAFQAYSKQSNCIKSCDELFVPCAKCTFGLTQGCNSKLNESLWKKLTLLHFFASSKLNATQNRYKNFLYLSETWVALSARNLSVHYCPNSTNLRLCFRTRSKALQSKAHWIRIAKVDFEKYPKNIQKKLPPKQYQSYQLLSIF